MDQDKFKRLHQIIAISSQRNDLIYAISPDFNGYIPANGIIFPDYYSFSTKELIAMLENDNLTDYIKTIEINLDGNVDWTSNILIINPKFYIPARKAILPIPPERVYQSDIFEPENRIILSIVLKRMFQETKTTTWSFEADVFIDWCILHNFENESFQLFAYWFEKQDIVFLLKNEWGFFKPYSSMVTFANDWVIDHEKNDFYQFYFQKTSSKV